MASTPFGKLTFREAIVDLLGALVPGVVFIMMMILTLVLPLWVLLEQVQLDSIAIHAPLNFMRELVKDFRAELTGLALICAYVIGHLFYRLDPKRPDERSFRRLSKAFEDDQAKSWPVRWELEGPNEKDTERIGFVKRMRRIRNRVSNLLNLIPDKPGHKLDIQFPYRFLREYLQGRGLDHIANLVPWSGAQPSLHSKRTKAFINILKIRLLFYFPNCYTDVAKNEAHIRLMSSFWYVLRALKYVSVVAIMIIAIVAYSPLWQQKISTSEYYLSLVASCVAFVLYWYMQVIVERFFHYMRVREIIFVLETAFTASKKHKSICEDLDSTVIPVTESANAS